MGVWGRGRFRRQIIHAEHASALKRNAAKPVKGLVGAVSKVTHELLAVGSHTDDSPFVGSRCYVGFDGNAV